MLLALFFAILISNGFAIQTKSEVCSLLSICEKIGVIRSQVADIREKQERQANILEGNSLSRTATLKTKNNNEMCALQSICTNLEALSSELSAVQAELERQADLIEQSCEVDTGPRPANCYEAFKESQKSGVTVIRVPEVSEKSFKVACDQETNGGGWTIILRRMDGSEDFFREWNDYEKGFGQADGEYFVGLTRLHALTSSVPQELLILMEDYDGEQGYEVYDNFRVGGKANNYTLESVGSFSGTAGDSLTFHEGMQFSTKDRDNDIHETIHCAVTFTGAWWYRNCQLSNLAGVYHEDTFGRSVHWYTLNGFYESLKTAVMMIRPKPSALKG